MNELSIINDVTSIANNTTSLLAQFEACHDTRTIRKAAAKLQYAVETEIRVGQFARSLNLEAGDLKRVNQLIDSFTYVACNDILRS
jgi:hypothetical protein